MRHGKQLEISPLSRRFQKKGTIVRVHIFRRLSETTWALEVVDEEDHLTRWEEQFDSDREALEEFMRTAETSSAQGFCA